VLLTWPHRASDWAPLLDRVEPVYDTLLRTVSTRQEAIVICLDADHVRYVERRLIGAGADLSRVRLYSVPTNDTWVRDYGPITVLENGRPLLLDFRFDGWGGKFEAARDDAACRALHAAGAFGTTPLVRVERVIEGGSIDCDGAGTLLTTRRCLMARARPGEGPGEIEAALRAHLGAERVLWLEHGGLEGDDTDAHVDTLARFCAPDAIAYVRCDDPDDAHYPELAAMEAELLDLRTAAGQPYRLLPLPWPRAKRGPDRERLPATYANFLVLNDAVLVPTYDDPADGAALERIGAAFPGREAFGVASLPLVLQHGSLHCATMQILREVFRR
jgi:agmatine/peptidylarginine deiminase